MQHSREEGYIYKVWQKISENYISFNVKAIHWPLSSLLLKEKDLQRRTLILLTNSPQHMQHLHYSEMEIRMFVSLTFSKWHGLKIEDLPRNEVWHVMLTVTIYWMLIEFTVFYLFFFFILCSFVLIFFQW